MKKKIVIITIIATMAFVGAYMLLGNRIKCSYNNGEARFEYGHIMKKTSLAPEDIDHINTIFSNKKLYVDHPSCGFNSSISIVMDDTELFCFAQDGCPIVYYENRNRYFRLSYDENSKLHSILKKYGFVFPCV